MSKGTQKEWNKIWLCEIGENIFVFEKKVKSVRSGESCKQAIFTHSCFTSSFFVCGTALAFAFAFGIASLSEIAKGERLNLRLVDWSSRHQENKFWLTKTSQKSLTGNESSFSILNEFSPYGKFEWIECIIDDLYFQEYNSVMLVKSISSIFNTNEQGNCRNCSALHTIKLFSIL